MYELVVKIRTFILKKMGSHWRILNRGVMCSDFMFNQITLGAAWGAAAGGGREATAEARRPEEATATT